MDILLIVITKGPKLTETHLNHIFFQICEPDKDKYHMDNEGFNLHYIDQSKSHDDSYKSHDNTQFKKKQVSSLLFPQ